MNIQNTINDVTDAGDLNDYSPRLGDGNHLVAIHSMVARDTREKGGMIGVELVILESSVHAKGESRSDAWFVGQTGDPGLYAKKRLFAFAKAVVRSLGGDPDDMTVVTDANGQPVNGANGKPLTKGVKLTQDALASILDIKRNPGRGIVLRVQSNKGTGKKSGKDFVNNTYTHIDQTKEQIAKVRAAIEGGSVATPVQAQPASVAAVVATAPNMLDTLGL